MRAILAMIALASSAAALAQPTAQVHTVWILTKSWFQDGRLMCQYSNGTVLNIGSGVCPSTINR